MLPNLGIGQEPYLILTLHLDAEHYDADNYPLVESSIIPEFPLWTILPLLIVASLVVLVVRNRLAKKV